MVYKIIFLTFFFVCLFVCWENVALFANPASVITFPAPLGMIHCSLCFLQVQILCGSCLVYKKMGGRLNSRSFAEYSGCLIVAPKG